MTNAEILNKALLEAVNNGFTSLSKTCSCNDQHHKYSCLDFKIKNLTELIGPVTRTFYMPIIFDHNFAKAFFGDGWEEHLKEMVVKEDPLQYIAKYI